MHRPRGIRTKAYQRDPRLIDRAVQAIVRAYRPQRVIVFGSFARGDTHELSDLDLIVVKETEERFFDRIGRVRDTCAGIPINVQPWVYTPAEFEDMLSRGNSFLETALAEGVAAYEKKADGSVLKSTYRDRGHRSHQRAGEGAEPLRREGEG